MTLARHSLALSIGLWFFVASLFGPRTVIATEQQDATVERLANVALFAFGGIGIAGVVSEGEKDYKLISSSRDAEANFEKLFRIGNPQAKCYALVGLHRLNPEKFNVLSYPLRSSKIPVPTMSGCIMSHQTLSMLIKNIQAGYYQKE